MREAKIWHMVFFPMLQVIAGLVLRQRFGEDWTTALAVIVSSFFGVCTALLILLPAVVDLWRAQAFEAVVNPKRSPVTVSVQNLNEMSTVGVRIDMERMFARALMEFPKDMTENTWLKSGRWQSMGGAGREQFVGILRHWEAGKIIARRGNSKNSPYQIVRMAEMARIAGGRKI